MKDKSGKGKVRKSEIKKGKRGNLGLPAPERGRCPSPSARDQETKRPGRVSTARPVTLPCPARVSLALSVSQSAVLHDSLSQSFAC